MNITTLNVHAYSFYDGSGETLATWPEDPRSSMQAVKNMIRWRNVNMPGKKVFLTEWGWDGASTIDTPGNLLDLFLSCSVFVWTLSQRLCQ